MNNQTKNTRERVYEILEKFGFDFSPVAVLPQRRKLITSRQVDAISSAVDRIDDIITQTKQETYDKVDRFEVVDDTGRAYVKGSIYGSPVSIKLDLQDDDRTLKAFVTAHTALNKLGED